MSAVNILTFYVFHPTSGHNSFCTPSFSRFFYSLLSRSLSLFSVFYCLRHFFFLLCKRLLAVGSFKGKDFLLNCPLEIFNLLK